MILYRYINRQLFSTTVVVATVLAIMLLGTRFVQYLADAAQGEIAADAIFAIMLFRMPEFLQLILPLSFYIAVLLVYGRLHIDNEMVVIRSGGIGTGGLLRGLMLPVLVMMMVVGSFSVWLTPAGRAQVDQVVEAQKQRSALELLSPGRFHATGSSGEHRTTYAETLDREASELRNIFIADVQEGGAGGGARTLTVRARSGRLVHRDGMRYLKLSDGRQYRGQPGRADYQVADFEHALVRLDKDARRERSPEVRGLSMSALLKASTRDARAELEWRISVIVVVPLMILLAVPLSRANPRQGVFARLVPALLLFMVYLGALMVMRSRIEDYRGEALPWYLSVVWVHLVVAAGVAAVYAWPRLSGRRVG